jgi:hypothetical protein
MLWVDMLTTTLAVDWYRCAAEDWNTLDRPGSGAAMRATTGGDCRVRLRMIAETISGSYADPESLNPLHEQRVEDD